MDELKYQALLGELETQRNWALTRGATLAAELAAANERIKSLTGQAEKQAEEIAKLKEKKK